MSTKEGKLIHSLAHTKWNCKYHIAFVLKYRRKVLRRKKNDDKMNIVYNIRMEGVEIIEGEICSDYVHLLLSIPHKMSVSYFIGYLKGKSIINVVPETQKYEIYV